MDESDMLSDALGSSNSENEDENLSQAELNYVLGKKSGRVAWSKREIDLMTNLKT